MAAAPGVLLASTLLWQGAARGLALAPCCFPSSECCRIQSTSGHVVKILQQNPGEARSVPACLPPAFARWELGACASGSPLGGRYPHTQLAWGSGAKQRGG